MSVNLYKTLFLFTDSFPYHTREVYIETEILYLSKHFKKIYIFPINVSGVARPVPDNVEIINIHQSVANERVKYFFKSFFLTLKIYLDLKNKKVARSGFKKNMLLTYNAFLYVKAIENFIEEKKIINTELVIYSYWFLHWSYIIAMLKRQHSNLKAYSRAHMGDLYDNMCDHTFAEYKLQYLDKLFPISKDGQKHLTDLFPEFHNKIEVSYLGVKYIDNNPNTTGNSNYIIVSCSSMNSQKRIESFFEVLSHIRIRVTWVHFGGMDSEIEALKSKIDNLPSNISVIFYGYIPNHQILEYYKNNHVDLFLNLSLSEGIPVTIMEAISFGIPAMATNVCGSPEIVSFDQKMVIPKDFDAQKVAKSIEQFLLHDANDKYYREKVLNFWNTHFNAELNYENFAKIISS